MELVGLWTSLSRSLYPDVDKAGPFVRPLGSPPCHRGPVAHFQSGSVPSTQAELIKHSLPFNEELKSNLLTEQLVFTAPPSLFLPPPSLHTSPSSSQTLLAVHKLALRSQVERRREGTDGPYILPWDRVTLHSGGERVCSGAESQATELLGTGILTSLFCPYHRGHRACFIRLLSGSNEICVKMCQAQCLAWKQPTYVSLTPKKDGTRDL